VKLCVVIPCYNHAGTVAAVTQAAQAHAPVLVVDDGSTVPLPELPGCTLVRLERNQGKAAALRAGFKRAAEMGLTHAITMDSDGQHFTEDLPKFLAIAREQPDVLALGVRDFYAAGCPTHRRRSNAVSTFWFRVETGVRLGDTQCGFRCYPIALTQRLKTKSSRYAFELEFMVRASWVGTVIVPVPVKCTYDDQKMRQSHFRPVKDLAHITFMNIGLVLQSWFVPQSLRIAWSCGQRWGFRRALHEFFSEHAHDPLRMSLAVGLGLFFGIVPIWGFQMVAAAAAAHRLRLNKAIALVTSNISIPPMVPFLLFAATALGHYLFTGQTLMVALTDMTPALAREFIWQWLVGSILLAIIAAVLGTASSYIIARLFWRK
jgi:glycosyltransferase involved in cell wall biosynthesis